MKTQRIVRFLFTWGALCVLAMGSSSDMLSARGRAQIIYAFRNYTRPEPIRMLLVGEIRSKIKVARPRDPNSPYLGYDTRADQVTVKVANRTGLKVGQKLYIIDKNPYHKKFRNGLIAGEIRVRAIFYHPFFGWVLTGTGILLRVREGMFVARTLDTEKLARAFDLKKRGDFHLGRGDVERAIASYHSALEADRALPEAHAALGKIYLQMAMSRRSARALPIRALAEFRQAWKNRKNFRYRSDRYRFYVSYMEALHHAREMDPATRSSRSRTADSRRLDRIIQLGKAADGLLPGGRKARVHMARAHFNRMLHYRERATVIAQQSQRIRGQRARARFQKLYASARKKSRDSRKKTAGLLRAIHRHVDTSPTAHGVAFLFYHDVYAEMLGTTNRKERKRLARFFYYSSDYARWADVQYRGRASGERRAFRLLRYHAGRYYRYRTARMRNPQVDTLYTRLFR